MEGGGASLSKGSSRPKMNTGEGSSFLSCPPPLEKRTIPDPRSSHLVSALNKRWVLDPATKGEPPAPSKWTSFSPPPIPMSFVGGGRPDQEGTCLLWLRKMMTYRDSLRFLLGVPHHRFWSIMVFCPEVRERVLGSFLKNAPRVHEERFEAFEGMPMIWPVYQDIYLHVFRIFMRLSTFKESKEDHITPSYWARLLRDNGLLNLDVLLHLSSLYESKDNPLFKKMVENVIKHDQRLVEGDLESHIPALTKKFFVLVEQTKALMENSAWSLSLQHPHEVWMLEGKRAEDVFGDILQECLAAMYSLYKFLKSYPPAATTVLNFSNFLSSMPVTYEQNTRTWALIADRLPQLHRQIESCRTTLLRLYRFTLATPTLHAIESANDKKLDEFFEHFCNSIDEKLFIIDYEKNFPFKADMQALLARGIFVDETRIDYVANAILGCFHSYGQPYSADKIVVDPLYDPNFDRQLLGACSLDITGVELVSLITQVKELLPDLPDSYVEAVLKHYGYSSELAINGLLEGSVPSRLEKYKSSTYIESQAKPSVPTQELPESDRLPVSLSGTLITPQERRAVGEEKMDEETKALILRFVEEQKQEPVTKREESDAYVDHNLLPPPEYDADYDDEYDDTYDDVGAGMTEPDNVVMFKPLNVRKAEIDVDEEEEEEADTRNQDRNKSNAFCEDPAIARARMERKREETYHRRHPNASHSQPQQQQQRDVVGRAKGQGQESDVLYNRRQKNVNKGGRGNYKKSSDYKRREF